MEDNIIWHTEQNDRVEIGIRQDYYFVTVMGARSYTGRHSDFSPVPAAARAKAAKLGVVAFLGPVAVTAERKAKILELRTALFPPTPVFFEPIALIALEDKLEAARERVLRHEANPGPAYAARTAAETALAAWKNEHADEWAAVAAHRKAEADAREAQRKAEYEQSFVARGLD